MTLHAPRILKFLKGEFREKRDWLTVAAIGLSISEGGYRG
jgi:hypothetical protein